MLEIEFPMNVERITLPPRFDGYENRVALQRGPIVYCLEEQDLAHQADLATLYIPEDESFTPEHRTDLLGGITILKGHVRQLSLAHDRGERIATILVPYGVWANRTPGAMRIWLGARRAPLVEVMLPEQVRGESCIG